MSPSWSTYAYLLIAVLFETFGSTCLQASQQFTKLVPSLGVLLGFAGAFYFFTLVLRDLPWGSPMRCGPASG